MECTSPARLARQKRLSHDEEDVACDTKDFVRSHRSALLATFVVAWVWFSLIVAPLAVPVPPAATLDPPRQKLSGFGLVLATGSLLHLDHEDTYAIPLAASQPSRPPAVEHASKLERAGLAMATGSPMFMHLERPAPAKTPPAAAASTSVAAPFIMSAAAERAFVLTCALVHTLIVCVGLAIGSDTRHSGGTYVHMLQACVGAFVLLCAALFLSWEWQLGPVPPVAQRIFGSQSAYVLVGAASATLWLCVPMCLEHTATGRAWTTSPSMCALTALAGATLLGLAPLAELSLGGTAMCFAGIVGSTAMAAAPRGHLASSGMWNL